ncbi:MAG: sigma-70 family RNA polymerase sigma factor [Candidatus Brocadia sp.]|nr:MAG: sigma-70 family RNA polymerase sigma factor [Candidatus Brocadia sp.]
MKEKNLEFVDIKEGLITGERGLLRMFLKDVESIQMLTKEEEMSVARRSRLGDEASRNHLVESNLRFVIKVVFQYWSPGLPLMDMISEGCQGLVKAAKTFDPDMGCRFLSYAGVAIVQGVIRAIQDHKQYEYESLDELIFDDGSEVTQEDLLESNELQCDDTVFLNQVRDMLNHLNDRERIIITLRFWHNLTLEEIASRINVTKETVRKIEARALRKLRWAIDERTMIGHGSYADTAR